MRHSSILLWHPLPSKHASDTLSIYSVLQAVQRFQTADNPQEEEPREGIRVLSQ